MYHRVPGGAENLTRCRKMPEFAYVARTAAGEDITGTLVAGNKREAISALAEKSLFPVRVQSRKQRQWLPTSRRVGTSILVTTLTQLADLLQNGAPLLEALTVLAEQGTHAEMTRVLCDVRDRVADGASLDEAMGTHPHVFNELTLSMVRAGSEGAFLEDALKRTANFLELQEELKSRITGAMFYPAFLSVVGVVITTALIVFFVPRFAELFDKLEREGGGLPAATVMLLGLSNFLSHYGTLVLLATVGLVWYVARVAKSQWGRLFIDRWKLKVPLFGPIFLGYAVSRFCRILGTLLRNGVPLLKALEISSDSAGNRILAEAIRQSVENVSSGETLSQPLAQCGLIPRPIMAMITVAEESNNLDEVLVNIADGLDRKLNRQIEIMVRMLEPMMLLVMGVIIMFVLVALLLPVIEMSTSM